VDQARSEVFAIDGEYQGFGRREFPGMGRATLKCTSEGDAAFRVLGGGQIVHPGDNAAVYEFKIDMRFRLRQNTVQVVSAKNSASSGGEDILQGIEKIAPFVYLVKTLPFPTAADRRYTLTTPRGTFALSYAGTPARPDVTLQRGAKQIGRFSVSRGTRGGTIVRFWLAPKNNLALSFVAD
jgi:hypothetical protein